MKLMASRLLLSLLFLTIKLIDVRSELALNINFGVSNSYKDVQGNIWVGDSQFDQSGSAATIKDYRVLPPYDTLRYFPSGPMICGEFPATKGNTVFFRAFFFYGNYDGKDYPPTFGLWSYANLWTKVATDLDHLFVYHANYTCWATNFTVCLTRSSTDDTPFINALQIYEGSIPSVYPPFVSPSNGGAGSGNVSAPPPDDSNSNPGWSPPPPDNTDLGHGSPPPPPNGSSSGSTPTVVQHSGSHCARLRVEGRMVFMLLGMTMGPLLLILATAS